MLLGMMARNARLDALSAAYPNARLRLYSGAKPATANLAAVGLQLVELVLGAVWAAAAVNGVKAFAVPVQGVATAGGTGTAPDYFRLYDSAAAVCVLQGSVGTAAGAGIELVTSLPTIAAGQVVRLDSFELTEGNG